MTVLGTGHAYVGLKSFALPATLNLSLAAGQEVEVSAPKVAYYVRCLPADFPSYTSTLSGTPQANGYLVTPDASLAGSVPSRYVVAFDHNGVPVWWLQDPNASSAPFDAKFLQDSLVSWWDGNVEKVWHLNGKLARTIGNATTLPLDLHDLQKLPNGNYLAIQDVNLNCPATPSQCVDLSSWGRSSQSGIIDNQIVEITPANKVVWRWSTAAHINVATADTNWRDQFPDVIHMNSILYDGNGGIIFSARHLDSVYRIDMATGDITWQLGGTPTAQSLTVVGDPSSPLFSGQHDARIAPDGTLTIHDNGTRADRPARALRFQIDPVARTATEVEAVTDVRNPTSLCCGSVQKLSAGDWIATWGGNDYVTEINPEGVAQITIDLTPFFSYRVAEVTVPISALRNGMNQQVPILKASNGGISAS